MYCEANVGRSVRLSDAIMSEIAQIGVLGKQTKENTTTYKHCMRLQMLDPNNRLPALIRLNERTRNGPSAEEDSA